MIGYKAFDKDLRCMGFQFEVGKTYSTGRKKEELELCTDTVFHFCRELHRIECESAYKISESRICEVIATGDIIDNGGKFGTNEIMILRELSAEEIKKFNNWNTGDWNTGYWNTGDWNTGDWNTGSRNTGYCNTGSRNTGDWNTGDWNTGSRNTGDWNTGDWNTGDWNTGSRNTGYCNTITPPFLIFNKETDKERSELVFPDFFWFEPVVWVSHDTATDKEKEEHKAEIETCGGFLKVIGYKEAFKLSWRKADKEDREKLFRLPNFDPAVFKEISGIDTAKAYKKYLEEHHE